ncbi:MAG TPA: EpsG family protein [Chitinophagaceae bacterium]|nr:EpsG family protein [Chitinophagaceae bacterium]
MNKTLKIQKETATLGFRNISFGHWMLFFLWPFAMLVRALGRWKSPDSKTVFWLFCMYFGFTFVYADIIFGAADSARYAAQLILFHSRPFSLTSLFDALYNPNEGFVDIYQPLMTWIVAQFTDDPRYLFLLFSIVFGFFYTQNLWIVFRRIKVNSGFFLTLLMFSYALINPIWNINGVRMWTAAHVFLYGILLYFLLNKKKGIIWMFSSALFHFSFLYPILVFTIWLLVPKRLNLFFALYAITTFIDEINLIAVRDSLSFLPEVFMPRVEGYTNIDYAQRIAESKYAWHVVWAGYAFRFSMYAFIIFSGLSVKKWKNSHPEVFSLFLFALLLGSAANLASNVPSGGRFLVLSNSLFFVVFITLYDALVKIKGLQGVKAFNTPTLLFSIIFNIRTGFDYAGFLLFIGNPVFALLIPSQTPIIDFIKAIF